LKFSDFPFKAELLEGIETIGFVEATPIQEQSIPLILDNRDMIGCAQTGTGKTAAFLLPIINKLIGGPGNKLNTIIITPTRELALQIDQQLEGLSYFTNTTSLAIYGGSDGETFLQQKSAIISGIDVIVATPGKLLSHMNLGYVDCSSIQHLILDEADRMLDMGFYDDIMRIVRNIPESRQTILFSATMPNKIKTLANKLLKNPAHVSIAISKPAEGILQAAYDSSERDKAKMIGLILKKEKGELPYSIIFCSTKKAVKSLEKELKSLGIHCAAVHSDLDQREREEVLRDYRGKRIQVLVATDVLSRGIDIDNIELVINYHVPSDPEDYIHRIGRTARANSTGVALTFISKDESMKFKRIERLLGKEIKRLPSPQSSN
jgi:ATP-dependent RNA helicase RhlE